VPPSLKKWAQEKETVENKVRARKEYAAKLRSQFKLKRKDKEQNEETEAYDMVAGIVAEAKLGNQFVDIFLKRFKILKLADFCHLNEADLSEEHMKRAEKNRLAAVLAARGVLTMCCQCVANVLLTCCTGACCPRRAANFSPQEGRGGERACGGRGNEGSQRTA
jgi:hypothetical protein